MGVELGLIVPGCFTPFLISVLTLSVRLSHTAFILSRFHPFVHCRNVPANFDGKTL